MRLEIDSTEPIGGWLAHGRTGRTRFDGWLQLISLLERTAGEAAAETDEGRRRRAPGEQGGRPV